MKSDQRVKTTSSFLRVTAIFAGGTLIAALLRAVTAFFTAGLVEPETLGLFQAYALIGGYLPFLLMGVSNGLNRELPYYRGLGQQDRMLSLAAAGHSWVLVVAGLAVVCLGSVSLWKGLSGDLTGTLGFAAVAGASFSILYGVHFQETTYRTSHDFKRLSWIHILTSVGNFLLLIVVAWWGFFGLCLRLIIISQLRILFGWLWQPFRIRPKWNWPDLRHLFKVGLPIFAAGQILVLWELLDSTLVWTFLGTKELGYYALTRYVWMMLAILPMALAQTAYPRMSQCYGETHDLKRTFRIAIKPSCFVLSIMIPIAVFSWIFLPALVNLTLPKYAPGIEAARWALVIVTLLSFQPMNNLFYVAKRQDLHITALLIGLGTYALVLYLLTRQGINLVAFPQAMSIGRGAYYIVCFVMAFRILKKV